MGTNKEQARQLAIAWWASSQGANSRARGDAVCDSCGGTIPMNGGYLCNPATVGMSGLPAAMFASPDLVCESCFDRKPYQPYDAEQTARMTSRAQGASDLFSFGSGRPSTPKKRWWEFWK